MTAPGIGWVLGYTIAAEISDIHRLRLAKEAVRLHRPVPPRATNPANTDRRGQLTKHGPKYLRWALMEAATHACRHPIYRERYQRNKSRLGKQRGAKVAQSRHRPQARRGDLAHAHPRPTLRSGRRHVSLWPHRRPF